MRKNTGLDVFIDKLTNSIENARSGDSFPTEISIISREELRSLNRSKGWRFNWKNEAKFPQREIYKLTIVNNANIIQGLISLEVKKDHVFIHLVESAPFNIGKNKIYIGVPGNLMAFSCKLSFQRGGDGYVSFLSKSKLVEHYKDSLGAYNVGGQLMVISTATALQLMHKYF